jgi:hypothetical protein
MNTQVHRRKNSQISFATSVIFAKTTQRKQSPNRRKFAQSGTVVMIFKIFSPKNLAKIFAFFAQTTVSFCKNCDQNIGFSPKIGKSRRKPM